MTGRVRVRGSAILYAYGSPHNDRSTTVSVFVCEGERSVCLLCSLPVTRVCGALWESLFAFTLRCARTDKHAPAYRYKQRRRTYIYNIFVSVTFELSRLMDRFTVSFCCLFFEAAKTLSLSE